MISKFCHIAIGNVKKNWCLTLLKKKYVFLYENLQLYSRLGFKTKKKYIVY